MTGEKRFIGLFPPSHRIRVQFSSSHHLHLRRSDNGSRIGDSGGLENLNFQSGTYLSNSLLLFSKFMKKGNIKDCCDKKKEKLSISPLNRHFANAMLSAVLL